MLKKIAKSAVRNPKKKVVKAQSFQPEKVKKEAAKMVPIKIQEKSKQKKSLQLTIKIPTAEGLSRALVKKYKIKKSL